MAQKPTFARPTARAGKPDANAAPFWTVKALGDGDARSAEITIYGYIGEAYDWWTGEDVGNSAKNLLDEVRALGDISNVTIRINSLGGDAWDGSAIYSVLSQLKARKTVIIDGIAASAASVIAMAGDVVQMPGNALMMIHNPSTVAWGDADDLSKAVAALGATKKAMISAYRTKNPTVSEADMDAIMTAETWYTGAEAVAAGFADEVLAPVSIAASAVPAAIKDRPGLQFKNAPSALAEILAASETETQTTETETALAEGETTEGETAPEVAPVVEAPLVDPILAALQAQVEKMTAQITALVAPPEAAKVPPVAPPVVATAKASAADLAKVLAFAVKHGVEETYREWAEMDASIEVVRAQVTNAAAAKEASIDGSTQPEGGGKPPPAKALTPSQIQSYYDKLSGATK